MWLLELTYSRHFEWRPLWWVSYQSVQIVSKLRITLWPWDKWRRHKTTVVYLSVSSLSTDLLHSRRLISGTRMLKRTLCVGLYGLRQRKFEIRQYLTVTFHKLSIFLKQIFFREVVSLFKLTVTRTVVDKSKTQARRVTFAEFWHLEKLLQIVMESSFERVSD